MSFIKKSPAELFKVRFLDLYMAGHKGFIAGGCFKNIFEGRKIKDIDIFFENAVDQAEAFVYFKGLEDYKALYENERVQAFKNSKTGMVVELIRGHFGTPAEMLENFDFSITKFAYTRETAEDGSITFICLLHDCFFEHLMCKKLVLEERIVFPVSTFERSLRYTRYGYGLCRQSKINLIQSLQGVQPDAVSQNLYFGFD